MLFSLLVYILVTVFSGSCQAMQNCQVQPESYTLDVNKLENSVVVFQLSNSNCTDNNTIHNNFFTCSHPSTLTNSHHDTGSGLTLTTNHIWRKNTTFQVLFTFSSTTELTRVNLYYYKGHYNVSDENNVYGLPGLRFYAVPDDYEFGSDLPNNTEIIHNVSKCLGRNYFSGRHSIKKINISQPTESKKMLMVNISPTNEYFALSKVEFFADSVDSTTTNLTSSTTSISTEESPTVTTYNNTDSVTHSTTTGTIETEPHAPSASPQTTTNPKELTSTQTSTTMTSTMIMTTTNNNETITSATTIALEDNSSLDDNIYIIIAPVAAGVVFIGLIIILIVIIVLLKYRKSVKNKPSGDNAPQNIYDQLSHQIESTSPPTQTQSHVTPNTGVHHHILDEGNDIDISDGMYDVIGNGCQNQPGHTNVGQSNQVQDSQPSQQAPEEPSETVESKDPQASQATYAVVEKKKKDEEPLSDGDPPPIPQHTVGQLYAAVHKKQANNTKTPREDNDDDAPPIPPYTVEEL